jgi:hypothetical protein
MIRFFLTMGPMAWPLSLLVVVNVVLIVLVGVRLGDRSRRPDVVLENRLNAILFWGAMAMVLGFLGQYAGIYRALHAIIGASAISPRVVAMGFAESFTTTLFGLQIFVVSAVAWFALSTRYRRSIAGAGSWERGVVRPGSALGSGTAS